MGNLTFNIEEGVKNGFSQRASGDIGKVLERYLLRVTTDDEKLESFSFTSRAL
jgi:hypothetical protein